MPFPPKTMPQAPDADPEETGEDAALQAAFASIRQSIDDAERDLMEQRKPAEPPGLPGKPPFGGP